MIMGKKEGMDMVYRKEYRGCLKSDINEQKLKQVCETLAADLEKNKNFIEVMLYRHHSMLFLYFEARVEDINPDYFLQELNLFLETWPEENGVSHWAYMYPIFYHQIPDDEKDWNIERAGDKTKIGRIAFLKEDKLFSYVYWHKALVDEKLIKGDKYQYISLHENILFSYFEEPRNNMNLSGSEKESEYIKNWLALDPGSHFQLDKTDGEHFKVLEPIIKVLNY